MDVLHSTAFYELATLLALASAIGLVGLLLGQPLIVAFIAVGIIAGPDVLGQVQSLEHVELLAEIGIAVLLFLVGLKLDLQLVRTLGPVAVATGLGQVAFTAFFGFLICLALGLDTVTSAYVAVALTFSSTIIIVKLLSDKREIDSLHGRIALGFLIVQDIAVVLAMVVLSAVGIGTAEASAGDMLTVVLSGIALVAAVGFFIRYVAEPLISRMANLPELMVTFAIAWAVMLAALSDWLGFGKELGGLLAGVSLASTSFRDAIASRLSSLRDFLLLFFFIALGARLDLGDLGDQLFASLVLSLFVLIGNPLIVLAIMGYMGYRKRTGFLAGLTVAQISEFSLIFMAMGMTLGHVHGEAMGLVTLVGLVTITLSTYMIVHSQRLYTLLESFLGPFERADPHREQGDDGGIDPEASYDVILFGVGRYGREIAKGFRTQNMTVLGVDFDPEAMALWRKRGHAGLFGDAGDPEFIGSLPLTRARFVVVAIPGHHHMVGTHDPRLTLLGSLREAGYAGRIVLTSRDAIDTKHLLHAGADIVISPFKDAASRAVERILGAPAGSIAPHFDHVGDEHAAR